MDFKNQKAAKINESSECKVSWIDKLILWIDHRSWPAWVTYLIFMVAGQLMLNITFWIDGSVPLWKNVTLPSISYPLITAGMAFYHYISKAGSNALKGFRPLLEADDREIAHIHRTFNYLPPWVNWIVLIWGFVGSIPYAFSGSNTFGEIVPLTLLPITFVYFTSVLSVFPFLYLIFRIIRQLRILPGLQRRASNINLLYLEPAHSFARLTASTGGGLILLMVLGTLYNPELSAGLNLFGTIFMVFFAFLIFVVPLVEMRNHLINEKSQRLREISELLQLTIERIHAKIKNPEIEDMAEAKSTMSILIEERALIEKVSTWPWDSGTIRGFASTLILPIALWFITNFLERFF